MDMMPYPPSFILVLGLDGDLQCSKKIKQSRVQIKKRALILNAAERVFARYDFSGSRLKRLLRKQDYRRQISFITIKVKKLCTGMCAKIF